MPITTAKRTSLSRVPTFHSNAGAFQQITNTFLGIQAERNAKLRIEKEKELELVREQGFVKAEHLNKTNSKELSEFDTLGAPVNPYVNEEYREAFTSGVQQSQNYNNFYNTEKNIDALFEDEDDVDKIRNETNDLINNMKISDPVLRKQYATKLKDYSKRKSDKLLSDQKQQAEQKAFFEASANLDDSINSILTKLRTGQQPSKQELEHYANYLEIITDIDPAHAQKVSSLVGYRSRYAEAEAFIRTNPDKLEDFYNGNVKIFNDFTGEEEDLILKPEDMDRLYTRGQADITKARNKVNADRKAVMSTANLILQSQAAGVDVDDEIWSEFEQKRGLLDPKYNLEFDQLLEISKSVGDNFYKATNSNDLSTRNDVMFEWIDELAELQSQPISSSDELNLRKHAIKSVTDGINNLQKYDKALMENPHGVLGLEPAFDNETYEQNQETIRQSTGLKRPPVDPRIVNEINSAFENDPQTGLQLLAEQAVIMGVDKMKHDLLPELPDKYTSPYFLNAALNDANPTQALETFQIITAGEQAGKYVKGTEKKDLRSEIIQRYGMDVLDHVDSITNYVIGKNFDPEKPTSLESLSEEEMDDAFDRVMSGATVIQDFKGRPKIVPPDTNTEELLNTIDEVRVHPFSNGILGINSENMNIIVDKGRIGLGDGEVVMANLNGDLLQLNGDRKGFVGQSEEEDEPEIEVSMLTRHDTTAVEQPADYYDEFSDIIGDDNVNSISKQYARNGKLNSAQMAYTDDFVQFIDPDSATRKAKDKLYRKALRATHNITMKDTFGNEMSKFQQLIAIKEQISTANPGETVIFGPLSIQIPELRGNAVTADEMYDQEFMSP